MKNISFVLGMLFCHVAFSQPNMNSALHNLANHSFPNYLPQTMMYVPGGAPLSAQEDWPVGPAAFVTVYTKDKTYQGIGLFCFKEGSFFKGTKDTYYIRLGNLTFFPEDTDSISYMDQTGLGDTTGWLFRKESGRITAYTKTPLGKTVKVAYADGPIKALNDTVLGDTLASTPIAYALESKDKDYAIRMYNEYHGIDVYDSGYGISQEDLRILLFTNSMSDWDFKRIKKSNPNGALDRLAKAKWSCKQKNFDEAYSLLKDLKSQFADFYMVYSVEGSCREAQGDPRSALAAYRLARLMSPDDKDELERISHSIRAMEKSLQRK